MIVNSVLCRSMTNLRGRRIDFRYCSFQHWSYPSPKMLNITNWWSIYIYSTSYLKIKKTGVFWKRLTAGLLIACDRFLTSTRAEIMPIFFWDFSFPLHAFSVHSLDAAITRFRAISIFFPFCPLSLKNSDEKFEIILVEILTTINSITFFRFCGYPWTKTWIYYFILST